MKRVMSMRICLLLAVLLGCGGVVAARGQQEPSGATENTGRVPPTVTVNDEASVEPQPEPSKAEVKEAESEAGSSAQNSVAPTTTTEKRQEESGFFWPLASASLVSLSLASSALYLGWRLQRRFSSLRRDVSESQKRTNELDNQYRNSLANARESLAEEITKLKERALTPSPEQRADLTRLLERIDNLESSRSKQRENQEETRRAIDEMKRNGATGAQRLAERIEKLERRLGEIEDGFLAQPKSESPAELERRLLRETWLKLDGREALLERIGNPSELGALESLGDRLSTLRTELGSQPELVQACTALRDPVRQLDGLCRKLAQVPRLVDTSNALPRLEDGGKDLQRTRECMQALWLVQMVPGVGEQLRFEPRQWVYERFLSFADRILRAYQNAVLEGDESLAAAAGVVGEILASGDVESIPVRAGKDPFDSSLHIGMGSRFDRRFGDGIVLEVVRAGFRERDSGRVLQAPEVIVNRI